jgi:hypothetical protein
MESGGRGEIVHSEMVSIRGTFDGRFGVVSIRG